MSAWRNETLVIEGGAIWPEKRARWNGRTESTVTSPWKPRRAGHNPAALTFSKTENLSNAVPGCSKGDGSPEGPGSGVYKPLMRKPRASLMMLATPIGILPGTICRHGVPVARPEMEPPKIAAECQAPPFFAVNNKPSNL